MKPSPRCSGRALRTPRPPWPRSRRRPDIGAIAEHPIVVGYRGTESAGAVHLGGLLAALLDVPLVVVSAYRYASVALSARAVSDPGNEWRYDAAQARVDAADLRMPRGVVVRERVVPADEIPTALADLAREVEACGLVVGRDLDGHVTRQLLEQAPCPVAVSASAEPRSGERLLRTIGVAFDASPSARLALMAAMRLATVPGAQVHVIAVGRRIPAEPVAAAAAAASLPGTAAVEVHRPAGDPGARLVEASEGLDLLLCGSHGYGRTLSRVLGSVSGHLVRAAHCPVLVVPPRVRPRPTAPLGLTTAASQISSRAPAARSR